MKQNLAFNSTLFTLTERQIRMVLPHRPPMCHIDEVLAWKQDDGELCARKYISSNDMMLNRVQRQSSDAKSALPSSLIIEALAQCSGLLLRLNWLAKCGADLIAFSNGDDSEVSAFDIPRSMLAESRAKFTTIETCAKKIELYTKLNMSREGMHRFKTSATCMNEIDSKEITLAEVDLTVRFPTEK